MAHPIHERMLAAAPNAIVVVDALEHDCPILLVNRAFEELTGYSAAEVQGRNCRILNQKARDQDALDEVRRAIAEKRACRVVLLNHRKDGSEFWNELAISPVTDESGRVAWFVAALSDVTHWTRDASAKSDLLVRFSQDLRTPIQSIMSWLKSVGGASVSTQAGHALNAIARSAAEIEGLANRLRGASDAKRPIENGEISEATLDGLRLLLVDDDAMTNEAMKELLEHQGATVLCVESSREALALCDQEKFDLLISDIALRDEDGIAFMQELRRREQGANRTPALAMSGYTSPEAVAKMMSAGFDGHIAKPVDDFVAFRARIRALARKSASE